MSAITARGAAFTLLESIVVFVLITGLAVTAFFLVLPRVTCRGVGSRRLVCAANIKGIGTSMKIYANDNNGSWPMPAFDETQIGLIDYTVKVGGGEGSIRSPNRMQPSVGGSGGARQLSVTRAFWMIVRSGDVTRRQFICPMSGDVADPAQKIDELYDFSGYKSVSYGYQVPFGPASTRANEGRDNRMALAADRGPYVDAGVPTPNAGSMFPNVKQGASYNANWKLWRPFNSPNHVNEGQNVLFADGHAAFHRTPTVGIDRDNIYTVAPDDGASAEVWFGESPWKRSGHPVAPTEPGSLSGTDSVIYP